MIRYECVDNKELTMYWISQFKKKGDEKIILWSRRSDFRSEIRSEVRSKVRSVTSG